QAGREDARRLVAAGTGQGAAAQRGIDVDVAVGDDFGAGADHGHDDQVAAPGIETLAGTQRLVEGDGARRGFGRRGGGGDRGRRWGGRRFGGFRLGARPAQRIGADGRQAGLGGGVGQGFGQAT